MKHSLRRKRAISRDRRRGFATWELLDHYGPQHDDDGPAPIGPLSGFDLFLTSGMAKTVMMVVDVNYRAQQLMETERRLSALRWARGEPHRMSAMARAMLPREHEVRIEGRRGPDGRMMFLVGDPDRPSVVYAERVARRVGAG